jgi:hypothetical protein
MAQMALGSQLLVPPPDPQQAFKTSLPKPATLQNFRVQKTQTEEAQVRLGYCFFLKEKRFQNVIDESLQHTQSYRQGDRIE